MSNTFVPVSWMIGVILVWVIANTYCIAALVITSRRYRRQIRCLSLEVNILHKVHCAAVSARDEARAALQS